MGGWNRRSLLGNGVLLCAVAIAVSGIVSAQQGRSARPDGRIAARVNGKVITYNELADECIARSGKEVLDSMISRLIVMQEADRLGVKITAQEIDEEMRTTAKRLGMGLEEFLGVIKEKRNIPPARYAEEVVMPGIALKKIAGPAVDVAEQDIVQGFEAMYGEKIKCRWITSPDRQQAMKIWEDLRQAADDNNGIVPLDEFIHKVTVHSSDVATRSIGGQINPISHHTSPTFKELEKAAFAMKKDGEISKIVQVGDAYVILYRESYIKPSGRKLETVREQLTAQIREAKMREQVGFIFQELQKNARVENMITSEVTVPTALPGKGNGVGRGQTGAGVRR